MKKFVSFTDIKQFRNVVKNISLASQYVGQDENDEPIYDKTLKNPIITFKGTVKLHGTNAGVSYSRSDGIWFQSKSHIITIENDNAGFAFFAHSMQTELLSLFDKIYNYNFLNSEDIVTIFGEWCGGNIQKGVALNKLEKMFVIFAVKITPKDEDSPSYYIDSNGLRCEESHIYNIEDFKTYKLDIDFENPLLSQNKMIGLVNEVEKECPVAKKWGHSGTGEGIVWVGEYKDNRYIFKTKGEKHSISKVKVLVPVSVEKLNSINEFVEYAVTENRLNQGIEQVFKVNNIEPDIKKTGDFLSWIMKDIIKEELDVLIENGLTNKDVGKKATDVARRWFMTYL